jgi:hypothetical protein
MLLGYAHVIRDTLANRPVMLEGFLILDLLDGHTVFPSSPIKEERKVGPSTSDNARGLEVLCISHIPETMGNVQRIVCINLSRVLRDA